MTGLHAPGRNEGPQRIELTPRSWVLLQKLTVAQLARKLPFYTTWRFIPVVTRFRHWKTLSQMNLVHILTSYLFKVHFNISFHLCLGLSRGLFLRRVPANISYAFFFASMRATCSVHPPYEPDHVNTFFCDTVNVCFMTKQPFPWSRCLISTEWSWYLSWMVRLD